MTTMSVRNNISALNIRGNLRLAAKSEGKSTERLSSGYQISRASDGAAELAISEKMLGQIRGFRLAERNVEDAIALIRTAEGGLAVQNDMLQRMRELALASSNDVFGDLDRSKLADEYDALMEEIDRIAGNAEYNNIKLLNGSDITSDRAAHGTGRGACPMSPFLLPLPFLPPSPPGSMAVPGGSTDWSNVNGEDLTWLRDKIVNEIAPSAVSDIPNSHGGLGFLKGTNIQMGLSQGERGGVTTGSAMIQINATNVITLALMLDDDLLSDAVNAGTFTSEEAKRMLYETIGHELVHAVMYVVTSRGMTNATSDPFPSWYVDGMANALTGDGNWLTNYLSGSSIVYRVPDAEIRKTYDIAEAINATHNLNRFVQHPVYDDAGLGEVVIENGMYEPLEQVPDELLDSLDYITDITPQGDTGELCGPVPVSVETRIEGNLELLVKTYAVETVTEIAGTDWSYLGRTDDDRVTLITCISGKPRSRLVV